MARFIACLLLIFLATGSLEAQSKRNDSYDNSLKGVPFKERVVYGGGIGLSFGTDQDFFSIAPMIGYKVSERMLAGTGVTLRYTKYKFVQPAATYIDYGFNPFLRYTIFSGVFLHTEYEYLNYEFQDPVDPEETIRAGYNSFLAGGGFAKPVGDKATFYVLALYNFSYKSVQPNEYSPYMTPLILRAGFAFGF